MTTLSSKMANGHFRFSSLLICMLAVNGVASANTAVITLPGKTVQLRSEIAQWGYQFDLQSVHVANLMLPPKGDGPYLCTYPSSLDNVFLPLPSTPPIALFVSRGDCTFRQKAEVALALQQNFTTAIQYVIIYNNDPNDFSGVIGLQSNLTVPSIGFLSISTRAADYTMSGIVSSAQVTDTSPYLSAPAATNNSDWDYLIEMERWDPPTRGGGNGSSSPSADTFYWVRFVLFTVLILSPCLRGMYLWWMGGGRIGFRRNEQGRITGLMYVRPIPYWFAPSGGGTQQERSQSLTQEQVMALPEITYVPPPRSAEDDDDDDDDEGSVHGGGREKGDGTPLDNVEERRQAMQVDEVATTHLDDNDEEKGQAREQNNTEPEIHLPPTDPEPEIHLPPMEEEQQLTTTCTTCSICIDDFEAGERIRLLPKCRHAFHTDCIMPWLTERQGCCPLCKTQVLDRDDEETGTVAVASDTAVASEAPNVDTQRRPDNSPA
jgi:hypothetical protein